MKSKKLSSVILSVAMLVGSEAGAWGRFDGGVHPIYGGGWARPSPVIVHNTYVSGGGGCFGCGIGAAAVAGLVGGVIVGAAIAGSQPPPPTTTIVEQAPPQTVVVVQGPPIGTQVPTLPPGCNVMNINGNNYYQCGQTWYKPFFGGGGVYYTVVPGP